MGVVQLTILTMVMIPDHHIPTTNCLKSASISIISSLVTAVGLDGAGPGVAKCGMFAAVNWRHGRYADEYAFSVNPPNFMANYLRRLAADRQRGYRHPAVGYGTELPEAALTPLQTYSRDYAYYCGFVLSQTFGGARITGQISSVTVWGVIIPAVGSGIIGWFYNPSMYVASWNPHPFRSLARWSVFPSP